MGQGQILGKHHNLVYVDFVRCVRSVLGRLHTIIQIRGEPLHENHSG